MDDLCGAGDAVALMVGRYGADQTFVYEDSPMVAVHVVAVLQAY